MSRQLFLPLMILAIHSVVGNWIVNASSLTASASKLFPLRPNKVSDEAKGGNMGMCSIIPSSEQSAELDVQRFLSPKLNGQKFYVQGWRWHTLSLIRDSHRLKQYAETILTNDSTSKVDADIPTHEKVQSLNTAARHIVDFNLKGLQRIEDETFFPWLREKLIADHKNHVKVEKETRDAFQNVIEGVDRDRRKVGELASLIRKEVQSLEQLEVDNAISGSNDAHVDIIKKATYKISRLSEDISSITQSILDREDRLLVPAVAVLVPSGEQKSFNNKVLRNLGIFESRCHLVAMHDAVHDKAFGNAREKALFKEQIPSVARMMIGRWRNSLYNPKVGVLDEIDAKKSS